MKRWTGLCLFVFCLFVQKAAAQELKLDRWEARFVMAQKMGIGTNAALVEYNQRPMVGADVMAHFRRGEYWYLKSGLGFRRMRYAQMDYTVVFPCDNDGKGSYDFDASRYASDLDISFLNIPFLASRHFGKEDANHFSIDAGLHVMLPLRINIETTLFACGSNSGNLLEVSPYRLRSSHFLLEFAPSYQLNTSAGVGVRIQPFLLWSIQPLFVADPGIHQSRELWYGISIGFLL